MESNIYLHRKRSFISLNKIRKSYNPDLSYPLISQGFTLNVNAMAKSIGVSQSAVSQHLRVLKAAGLVDDERKGYWIHYSLNREALEKCRQRLNKICTCGCLQEGMSKEKK